MPPLTSQRLKRRSVRASAPGKQHFDVARKIVVQALSHTSYESAPWWPGRALLDWRAAAAGSHAVATNGMALSSIVPYGPGGPRTRPRCTSIAACGMRDQMRGCTSSLGGPCPSCKQQRDHLLFTCDPALGWAFWESPDYCPASLAFCARRPLRREAQLLQARRSPFFCFCRRRSPQRSPGSTTRPALGSGRGAT